MQEHILDFHLLWKLEECVKNNSDEEIETVDHGSVMRGKNE